MFFLLTSIILKKPMIHFPIEKVTNHKYQRPQNNSNNAHKQGCYIIIPAIIIWQKKENNRNTKEEVLNFSPP